MNVQKPEKQTSTKKFTQFIVLRLHILSMRASIFSSSESEASLPSLFPGSHQRVKGRNRQVRATVSCLQVGLWLKDKI